MYLLEALTLYLCFQIISSSQIVKSNIWLSISRDVQ